MKAAGIEQYLYLPYKRIKALYIALSKKKYIELYRLLISIVFIICFKYIYNINTYPSSFIFNYLINILFKAAIVAEHAY